MKVLLQLEVVSNELDQMKNIDLNLPLRKTIQIGLKKMIELFSADTPNGKKIWNNVRRN